MLPRDKEGLEVATVTLLHYYIATAIKAYIMHVNSNISSIGSYE
jgi:hypothetical protein